MRNNRNNGFMQWLRYQMRRRPLPLWMLVLTDLLLIAISLVIFALPHHVLSWEQSGLGVTSSRNGAASVQAVSTVIPDITVVPEVTAVPVDSAPLSSPVENVPPQITAEPVAAAQTVDTVGYFGNKFADKFTSGNVISTDTTYQSANTNITVTRYDQDGVRFYVADIYIRDISCFRTGFANDKFGKSISEWPADTAARMGAMLAINGDYYGMHSTGIVARNGVLYRGTNDNTVDIGVLFWDGTMETYDAGNFDAEAAMEAGAYQIWSFGPRLLDKDGQTMEKFNSNVNPANPRTAVGYFEPGHYCFVVVDGRTSNSKGLSLSKLSKLMNALGCVRAYNLDGGQTSQMVFNSTVVSEPYDGGRKCSDILAIVDTIQ